MIVSGGDRQLVLAVEPFGGHSDSTVPNAAGVFVAPNVSLNRWVRSDAAVMFMLPSCYEAAEKLQANKAELPENCLFSLSVILENTTKVRQSHLIRLKRTLFVALLTQIPATDRPIKSQS